MQLTDRDSALLNGEEGDALRLAMEIVVQVGLAQDAPRLVDIEGAHIDGCLYHGRAGLDLASRLAEQGAEVSVPTTLNVSSLDLLHPDLYRGDQDTAIAARSLMDAYVAMGCTPSWTCAPYQLPGRPELGQQIAWGESNAIVFANSVLGARTERYGDFMDIACALTGRAPFYGLHTDEGRAARLSIEVDVPDHVLDDDVVYPLLGHLLGQMAGTDVAAVVGLDERADEDRLKAIGAAAASSGAVAMFHAVGVTPEAPSLATSTGWERVVRRNTVTTKDLSRAKMELTSGSGRLGAVSVGTPHMSATEMHRLASMLHGRIAKVPFYVNTSRDVLANAESAESAIRSFGATIVTDTCTYITPVMEAVEGDVMTDSGKWAFYAPANLGVGVALGSLSDCVESAVAGRIINTEAWS
jgi:predicted aconitase